MTYSLKKRNIPPATHNRRRLRELPIPRIEQQFIPDPNDTLSELFPNTNPNASLQNNDESGSENDFAIPTSMSNVAQANRELVTEEDPLLSPIPSPLTSPIRSSTPGDSSTFHDCEQANELVDESDLEHKPDTMPIRRISFAHSGIFDIMMNEESQEERTQAVPNIENPSTSQMNIGTSAPAPRPAPGEISN